MIRVEELLPMSEDRRRLMSIFFRLTDYGPSDILAFSSATGTFLTRNGGKYRIVEGHLDHLAGPSPDPSERV